MHERKCDQVSLACRQAGLADSLSIQDIVLGQAQLVFAMVFSYAEIARYHQHLSYFRLP
jgi:hypothetical protein